MRKHEYDKAMFRLTTIIARLNLGERLYPKNLAEEFNVSVRTIQKDLNERLIHTFPIERNHDGAYKFADNFQLKGSIDPDQAIALALMDTFISQIDTKLKNACQKTLNCSFTQNNPFIMDLGFEDIHSFLDNFNLIRQCIDFRQSIDFLYTNKHSKTSEYHVDPYKIANFQGFWYLIAYDGQEEKLKTFYLKEIRRIIVSPENYKIDEQIEERIQKIYADIDSVWIKADKSEVLLKASGSARKYLTRNLPANFSIHDQSEDYILLKMSYYTDIEVLSLVKKWIPEIYILNNSELTTKLKEQLEVYNPETQPFV